MTISATAVKELRQRTGAGMMDCKKALMETGGDLDEAIKVLRTKGLSAAAKKAHRAASEGLVVVVAEGGRAVILELNCETDFVARNPEFSEFATALASQALSSGAADAEALQGQPLASDPGVSVEEAISQKVATIGENIVLSRVASREAGADEHLTSYVHMGGSIGVVVAASSSVAEAVLHDVALHVAAADPRYVSRDDVPPQILDTEREIALKQVLEQGKPEHIAERIVHGKIEKFFEQTVLLEQPFAKDPSKTVGEYLKEAAGEDATVNGFVRFKLGESASE